MQLITEKMIGIILFNQLQKLQKKWWHASPGIDVIFEHIGGSHWNKELTLLNYGWHNNYIYWCRHTGYMLKTCYLRHMVFKGLNIGFLKGKKHNYDE